MKLTLAACLIVFAAAVAYARTDVPARAAESQDLLENELLADVRCDDCVKKEEAIYSLGELSSEKAVIPLMNVLHQDETESSRIVAALALCRIGDARGTYAVKRAATFDKSEHVRTVCAWFYDTYVEQGSFKFVTTN